MCAKWARVLSKQHRRCGGVTQASPLLQLWAPLAKAITRGLNMCRECEQGGFGVENRSENAENSGDLRGNVGLWTERAILT